MIGHNHRGARGNERPCRRCCFARIRAEALGRSSHALAASDCAKLHDAPLKSDQAVLKVRIDEARADIMARQARLAALLGRGDLYGSVFELDFIAAGHANVVALNSAC